MSLHRIAIAAMLAGHALPAGAQDNILPLRSAEIYLVPPQFTYPFAALRDGIEGRCTIAFTIDAAGVPQDILPICTHAIFVQPAHDGVAATRLRISGAISAGQRLRLPISFRLGS